MKRRAILAAGGAWILFAGSAALAQSARSPRLIAVLLPGTQTGFRTRVDLLRNELARLGYVDGRDIVFEERFAEDRSDRLADIAAELVAKRPAVIVTLSTAGVSACTKATTTIPIVFVTAGSPVERGIVKSLRHPGGNVTGVLTRAEVVDKVVELGRETLPHARRFAILVHQPDSAHQGIVDRFGAAARKLRFEPVEVRVAGVGDLGQAFAEMSAKKVDLLFPANLIFSVSNIREITDRSLKARLPLFTSYVDVIATGILAAYGTQREENWRRAAALVDKILRGANPGGLPVEQPGKFELVVNLKTAKAIGVTLPEKIIARADKVIE